MNIRKATKTVAAWLGIAAGIAGLEHGYFEILQGNTRPEGLMIVSMGPPCVPDEIWNACEPAMTIIPNFLITGVLSVILGLLIIIWSVGFIHSKHGGLVLILLSVALLLFGSGIFPPVIGLVGGAAGTQARKPLAGQRGSLTRLAAKLWPWPLVIFIVWTLGQFPFGHFLNDFLQSIVYISLLVILTSLPLAIYTAYAYDVTVGRD